MLLFVHTRVYPCLSKLHKRLLFTDFAAWNIHLNIHQCPPPQVQEQPLQASHWPHLALLHHGNTPSQASNEKKKRGGQSTFNMMDSDPKSTHWSNLIIHLSNPFSISWLQTRNLSVHILVPLVEFKNAKKHKKYHKHYFWSARIHADFCTISMINFQFRHWHCRWLSIELAGLHFHHRSLARLTLFRISDSMKRFQARLIARNLWKIHWSTFCFREKLSTRA